MLLVSKDLTVNPEFQACSWTILLETAVHNWPFSKIAYSEAKRKWETANLSFSCLISFLSSRLKILTGTERWYLWVDLGGTLLKQLLAHHQHSRTPPASWRFLLKISECTESPSYFSARFILKHILPFVYNFFNRSELFFLVFQVLLMQFSDRKCCWTWKNITFC